MVHSDVSKMVHYLITGFNFIEFYFNLLINIDILYLACLLHI